MEVIKFCMRNQNIYAASCWNIMQNLVYVGEREGGELWWIVLSFHFTWVGVSVSVMSAREVFGGQRLMLEVPEEGWITGALGLASGEVRTLGELRAEFGDSD